MKMIESNTPEETTPLEAPEKVVLINIFAQKKLIKVKWLLACFIFFVVMLIVSPLFVQNDNKKVEKEVTDQKIKPYSHAKDKGNDHIVMKRPIVHPSSFNVSINATYGISWISFQVDKNPIRKMTLKKGSNIILKGESIKLVLGNYKALIIKNNKEVVPVKKNINGDIAKINFPQDKNDFSPAQKLIFTLESKVNDQAQRL